MVGPICLQLRFSHCLIDTTPHVLGAVFAFSQTSLGRHCIRWLFVECGKGTLPSHGRVVALPAPSPYYAQECRQARRVLSLPLILVGGMRTLRDMKAILDDGMADAVSMCRPFIMDPHTVRAFRESLTNESRCTSCNECLEDIAQGNPLRCLLA